jgi:hypothetical protein
MIIIKILSGFINLLFKNIGLLSSKNREIYKKRADICYECQFNDRNFCSLCGCYIPAKTKAYYDLDKDGKSKGGCPKKYW